MESRIYFKNLNGLRFIAATLVILHHVEQYKFWAKLPNIWGNTTIDALGHKAVSFFFVLSGFLITYLLLEEDKKTGDVNIKNFYVRRILRIWPLYFLIVLVSLFVIPNLFDLSVMGVDLYNSNFLLVTVLLILVLPNLVRMFSPSIVGGNQLWSIGVEEQFYLVWPILARTFMKSMFVFLVAFVSLKLLVTLALEYVINVYDILLVKKALRFWLLLQVEQMGIGAVGAWLLFKNKEAVLKIIYHRFTYYFSIAFMIALFIVHVDHWWVNYAEAAMFVIFIMNLSTNPSIKFNMENRLMAVLGNISYGIYMYHTICITVCLYLLRGLGLHEGNQIYFNSLLYALSITTTIVLAYFSYEFFEKKFLVLKERFMVVKSGKAATTVVAAMPEETISTPSGESVVAPSVVPASNDNLNESKDFGR